MQTITRTLGLALALASVSPLTLGQASPAREYTYFGSRLVAVDVRGNVGPNDLSYVAPPSQGLRRMTMKFSISDPDGGANTAQLNVIIGQWFNNTRTCYFHWVKWNNTFYLNNGLYGAAEQWLPMSMASGAGADVQSDNCKVYRNTTSVSVTGTKRELTVDLDLRAPLGGDLNVWSWGRDDNGLDIGWEHQGIYVPQNFGSATAIEMQNGAPDANRNVTFQFHVPDPDGARNMYQLNVLVNSAFDAQASCYFVVQTLNNGVWLYDGVSSWNSVLSFDTQSPASIESNYCKITLAGSGHAPLVSDPNKLVVTANVQFKAAMSGANKHVWVWTRDMAMVGYGWLDKATWTIP